MLVKVLVVALVVCAACAQLEQGILAAQYYPRPHVTFSTHAPRPADSGRRLAPRAPRTPRSYFDRDAALAEGNDAALRRALPHMADPRWTPDVRSRAPWLT